MADMKVHKKYLEVIAVALLYFSAFYIWTLPIHDNKYPFGDVDAASHFAVGDYMSTHDKSTLEVPLYVQRYKGQNEMYPDYLWYPPQFWTNMGIMQKIGGDRIVSFFIMIAFLSTLFILSCYFLIRKLFGFLPAFLSSFMLIFSVRDYMVYLFGQWPQSLGYGFTPLVLYCYYIYTNSILDKDKKAVYVYIMSLLLVIQNLIHPQGFIASVATVSIYSLILFIRTRKIPFNFKDITLIIIIFFILSFVLAPFNMGEFVSEIYKTGSGEGSGWDLGILFQWYQNLSWKGLPDFYFHYNTVHGDINGGSMGYWTLPLLFIGMITLFMNAFVFKKDKKNILLLSWLLSFYILTHLGAFGMGGRDHRMMGFEAHVIYPIIVIGLLSIPSFFKLDINHKRLFRYALVTLFIIFAITINAKSAVNVLYNQQYSIGRINPHQYEASVWILENIPETSYLYDIGTSGYNYYGAKVKWLNVLSQRLFVTQDDLKNRTNYVFLDYSDLALLNLQDEINSLLSYENSLFVNQTPIYNHKYIKVYKVAD